MKLFIPDTLFFVSMLCALMLWYIYDGYLRILSLISTYAGVGDNSHYNLKGDQPFVTILVTVHNEVEHILDRINNILCQDYPSERLEIIVASDGSTDGSDEVVMRINHPGVRLFCPTSRLGKTATQNLAIEDAKGEIIIFTDAKTSFDRCFTQRVTMRFADRSVGAVDGHLLFVAESGNIVAESQNQYWQYELSLRELESCLGILAVASGACLAVRKSLFRTMDPTIGEDCIVPLDVVSQGYRVIHAGDALAYEQMDNASEKEFRARVRMTLRNWQGTWSRSELLNPLRHRGVAVGLWSHKMFRWLSPFFVCGLVTSSNLCAWLEPNLSMILLAGAVDSFLTLGLMGWVMRDRQTKIPLTGAAFSFLLVNAGFFVGVLRALGGHRIRAYK